LTNAEASLVDGIRVHPWLNRSVLNDTFLVKKMTTDIDPHEFGDSWYSTNISYPGRAYLFIKATDYSASASFSFGQKPLFPMWVIYAAAGGGGFIFIVCVFICCCVVRRAGKERDDEMHSKVKKYQSKDITSEDKIARFKYGR
jgi:hypothetical protein